MTTLAAAGSLLSEKTAVAGLVLVRISAFVASCPPFAPEALERRFRAALAAALTVVMVGAAPPVSPPEHLVAAGVMEFLFGAAMGLGVRMGALAITFAGEMLETVAGFSFMQMVNPLSREQAGPMRMIFQVTGGLIFFVAGGQGMVVEALAESVVVVPPGQVPWNPRTGVSLVAQLSLMLEASLRLAAPMLAAALTTLLALAFLTKIAPQLNIWSVGFVVTSGIMLVGLIWYAPSWMESVAALWQERARGMMREALS